MDESKGIFVGIRWLGNQLLAMRCNDDMSPINMSRGTRFRLFIFRSSFRPIPVAFFSVFHGLYVSIDRRFEWPLQSESCRKQWSVVIAS